MRGIYPVRHKGNFVNRPCPVCLAGEIVPVSQVATYNQARCAACGHRFISDEISGSVLSEAYGEGYYKTAVTDQGAVDAGYTDYLAKAELRQVEFRRRLKRIERFSPSRGNLLDYGCAMGLFVKVAKEGGWKAKGYEKSRWAVDFGTQTLGLDITCAEDNENPFAAEAFDVITLWDVVEHLYHPREVFAKVRQWLRPGGVLALNTVNSSSVGARIAGDKWRHIAPPFHLQYFTRGSLLRLIREMGFEVRICTGQGALLESGRDSGTLAWPLATIERIATHWRLRRVADALNLLDEIEVIAVAR